MQIIPEIITTQVNCFNEPIEFEMLLVKHVFEFTLNIYEVENKLFYEVGKNDVDYPYVLAHETGELYVLDGWPRFVNTSLSQFFESVNKYNSMELPNDGSIDNNKRIALFDDAMKRIDEDCFRSETSFWSSIREQMVDGII